MPRLIQLVDLIVVLAFLLVTIKVLIWFKEKWFSKWFNGNKDAKKK
jgi:hypothetical protein